MAAFETRRLSSALLLTGASVGCKVESLRRHGSVLGTDTHNGDGASLGNSGHCLFSAESASAKEEEQIVVLDSRVIEVYAHLWSCSVVAGSRAPYEIL